MTILIFCFDGTWNGRDDTHATNIRKMWHGLNRDGQVPFYFAGPGNEDENSWLMEKLSGAFGVGSWAIRDTAIDMLAASYQPGHRIAVFGFSRGAAIARLFCARIARRGIYGQRPAIEMLGCFDTVFARLPFGAAQQRTLFSDLHVAANVRHAYHAVALDEDRDAFEPNLMNRRDNVTEVWFPGGHSDVGGGNPSSGLSDGVLSWMLDAASDHGMSHNLADIASDSGAEMVLSGSMLRHAPRRVGVKIDDDWADVPVRYHQSVAQRQRRDPAYRPGLKAA